VPIDVLFKHVPNALHSEIRSSRYIAERSDSLIIQSDENRKQNDNAHSCYARLHQVIVEAGRNALPGQTSSEQAKRVKDLYVALPHTLLPFLKISGKNRTMNSACGIKNSTVLRRAQEERSMTAECGQHTTEYDCRVVIPVRLTAPKAASKDWTCSGLSNGLSKR
jgi:hypothetical protein